MNHALFTSLLGITLDASREGMRQMTAAMSPVTGATLNLDAYNAGKARKERAESLSKRLRTHFEAKPKERTGTLTALDIALEIPATQTVTKPTCICERMYRTGCTNHTFKRRLHSGHTVSIKLDDHIRRNAGGLPADWFARTYDAFAFGESFTDPGCGESDRYWDEHNGRTLPAPLVAVKLKNFIEEACPANIHYPRLLLDVELGRDVYVSSDSEKRDEAQAQMESDWFDSSHPWVVYGRRENRGSDSGAGSTDVLQRQREERSAEVKPRPTQLRLSSDPEQASSTAERKALRSIQRTDGASATPFLRLVWAHKRRIRAKEAQARRDLMTFLRKLDVASDPRAIAWVRASVEKHGYVKTRDRLWRAKLSQRVLVRG